jgi:hypothetical protein
MKLLSTVSERTAKKMMDGGKQYMLRIFLFNYMGRTV